jgi:hypothetical protein
VKKLFPKYLKVIDVFPTNWSSSLKSFQPFVINGWTIDLLKSIVWIAPVGRHKSHLGPRSS